MNLDIGERHLDQRVLLWFNCSGVSGPKYTCVPVNKYSSTGEIAVVTRACMFDALGYTPKR
jgi:hypothetical protein